MNPHDEDIDRVLHALKATKPDEAMETRILRRLEARAESIPAAGWPRWTMRLGYALGAGAVFACVMLTVLHSGHRTVTTVESAKHVAASVEHVETNEIVAKESGVVLARKPVRVATGAKTVMVVAKGETVHEASFPAPPMPLTEQEKLLVRMVEQRTTEQPKMPTQLPLATEVAELRAASDKFFEDPTTGENRWKKIVAQQAAPN